jgi:hypothetical protein
MGIGVTVVTVVRLESVIRLTRWMQAYGSKLWRLRVQVTSIVAGRSSQENPDLWRFCSAVAKGMPGETFLATTDCKRAFSFGLMPGQAQRTRTLAAINPDRAARVLFIRIQLRAVLLS